MYFLFSTAIFLILSKLIGLKKFLLKKMPTPSMQSSLCRVDNATTQSFHWRVGAFFEIPPLPHFPWLYIIILKTKWNRVQNLLYEYIEYLYRYIYVFSFKYSNFIDIVKNHWIKIFSSWKKRLPLHRKVLFVALTTRHHAPPRCIALRICQYWNYMGIGTWFTTKQGVEKIKLSNVKKEVIC